MPNRYPTIAELTRDELEQVAAEFQLIFPNCKFTSERMRNLMLDSALYRDPDSDPEQQYQEPRQQNASDVR